MLDPRLLHHIIENDGPTIGLAAHAGHEIRPDFLRLMRIDEFSRQREEDPFTDFLTFACDSQFLPRRSRFEVDLNRRREDALCAEPADCWGLEIWQPGAINEVRAASLAEHDAFYIRLEEMLTRLQKRHGRFVVFDLHSYNHRRDGPNALPAPPEDNPEVNLGTGTMNRTRWAPVVDAFLETMRGVKVSGHPLDVRENVKFYGREIPRFVHERFPETGCALAIEFKKTFMDEWTGEVAVDHLFALRDALSTAVGAVTATIEAELIK